MARKASVVCPLHDYVCRMRQRGGSRHAGQPLDQGALPERAPGTRQGGSRSPSPPSLASAAPGSCRSGAGPYDDWPLARGGKGRKQKRSDNSKPGDSLLAGLKVFEPPGHRRPGARLWPSPLARSRSSPPRPRQRVGRHGLAQRGRKLSLPPVWGTWPGPGRRARARHRPLRHFGRVSVSTPLIRTTTSRARTSSTSIALSAAHVPAAS